MRLFLRKIIRLIDSSSPVAPEINNISYQTTDGTLQHIQHMSISPGSKMICSSLRDGTLSLYR